MTDIGLHNGTFDVVVSTLAGAIWKCETSIDGVPVPLMRPPVAGGARIATNACCFPLIPFGNRIRGNRFPFAGQDYALEPNTDWDKHYLHGDGWASEWEVDEVTETFLALSLHHRLTSQSPYIYDGRQTVALSDRRMEVTLSVTNRGAVALPFGLGWHPFFPLTEQTTLRASARDYWEEGDGWLPTVRHALPRELDFNTARSLPRHWVNNGFEGWDGHAEIAWPDRGVSLVIDADSLFERYFVFVSDAGFDPTYRGDFFCFEPMSHSADAHHQPDGGGLRVLAPGETLTGSIRFQVVF
jgi:aldose 1-epimerase